MTVKRLLAFLGAVALIVGAFVLRSALDDSTSSTSSGGSSSSGATTVICSTELTLVCENLGKGYAYTIEPAGKTLDRLGKDGAALPDAWITLDPFPGMLDASRAYANLAQATTSIVPIGSDTPTVAVPVDRKSSLQAGCATTAVWKCLGAKAGQPWTTLDANAAPGDINIGLDDPATAAFGLLTFANAVAGYFGVVQTDNSSWTDPGFLGWLKGLTGNVRIAAAGTTPLNNMLVRPSEVSVAATTEAQRDASSQSAKVYPAPVTPAISIVAVAATFTSRGRDLATKLAPLARSAGWSAPTQPAQVLSAGTFIALRTLWEGYKK